MKKIKQKIKYIIIACCTYKRPELLANALNSVSGLKMPLDLKVELVIVDNDADGCAKNIVESFKTKLPMSVHYFLEKKQGLSNARNRVLAEAINLGATHIAFFDDDEVVDSNWLVEHIDFYNKNDEILISSGPTYNKFVKKYPKFITHNNIFKQKTTKETGQIRDICASGNVFFPVGIAKQDNIYFDTSYVYMGGEDGDFFSRASKSGYTIAWNNEAVNYEIVDDERANLKWIFKRCYYNGYSGALLKFKKKTNPTKKILHIFKTAFVLLLDCLLVSLSLLGGLTLFFNALGITCKTYGKLIGAINGKPMNYYQKK